MKTIYTQIDGKYYQMNQPTKVPLELVREEHGITSKVVVDAGDKRLIQNVVISTINTTGTKSNKEMYNEMVEYLKTQKVTDIPVLPNFYVLYVDYSIFDGNKEIEHSCCIRPVGPEDKIYPLGVATNNETVYRRVKDLHQTIEIRTRVPIPHGISMRPSTRKSYGLKINNIIVYLDSYGDKDRHESTYENPYGGNTSTLLGKLDTLKPIFSTDSEGLDFDISSVTFMPRVITMDIEVILGNIIVAYTSNEVDKIIQDNLNDKYDEDIPTDPGEEGGDEGTLIPDPETRPSADGSEDPDDDGWFDYYERCTSTNPNRLLVVEDELSDAYYKEDEMVRQKDVIEDIPDIEIGEYVIYNEAMSSFL